MEITKQNMEAYLFACKKHENQKRPGTSIPYISHCLSVADIVSQFITQNNEKGYDLNFAQNVALLHDVLEDTKTTYIELKEKFGAEIANAVQSLTKDVKILKNKQLEDSLLRILKQRPEVALVKMADRYDNLRNLNTVWDKKKSLWYVNQAFLIVDKLYQIDYIMAEKLMVQIDNYINLINDKEKNGGFMIFLKANKGYLFAYDTSSSITLKFKNGKWELSEISYSVLFNDEDIREITHIEAKNIYKENEPQNVIDEFLKSL